MSDNCKACRWLCLNWSFEVGGWVGIITHHCIHNVARLTIKLCWYLFTVKWWLDIMPRYHNTLFLHTAYIQQARAKPFVTNDYFWLDLRFKVIEYHTYDIITIILLFSKEYIFLTTKWNSRWLPTSIHKLNEALCTFWDRIIQCKTITQYCSNCAVNTIELCTTNDDPNIYSQVHC